MSTPNPRPRTPRTRKSQPRFMLPAESGSFGNGQVLEWPINSPNLPADVDPVHAVAAAIFQHLVAHSIHVACQGKGWNVKEFAYRTGSIGYSSWDHVLNGRTLLRADHIGAAASSSRHRIFCLHARQARTTSKRTPIASRQRATSHRESCHRGVSWIPFKTAGQVFADSSPTLDTGLALNRTRWNSASGRPAGRGRCDGRALRRTRRTRRRCPLRQSAPHHRSRPFGHASGRT